MDEAAQKSCHQPEALGSEKCKNAVRKRRKRKRKAARIKAEDDKYMKECQ